MFGLDLVLALYIAMAPETNSTLSLRESPLGFSSRSGLPSGHAMVELAPEIAPMSFVAFCLTYPSDCRDGDERGPVTLTAARLAELDTVNRDVNRRIRPQVDRTPMRLWHLNVAAGDCNTYAVQKRHDLLQRGWPAASLLLSVVRTAWGEGHLILTVRTDRGDLVLDNLTSRIVPADATDYRWIMRQSSRRIDQWVAVRMPAESAPGRGHGLAAAGPGGGVKVASLIGKLAAMPAPKLASAKPPKRMRPAPMRPFEDRFASARQIGEAVDVEAQVAADRSSPYAIGQL